MKRASKKGLSCLAGACLACGDTELPVLYFQSKHFKSHLPGFFFPRSKLRLGLRDFLRTGVAKCPPQLTKRLESNFDRDSLQVPGIEPGTVQFLVGRSSSELLMLA